MCIDNQRDGKTTNVTIKKKEVLLCCVSQSSLKSMNFPQTTYRPHRGLNRPHRNSKNIITDKKLSVRYSVKSKVNAYFCKQYH